MHRFLISVFLINLGLRFTIENISFFDKNILFTISRLLLIIFILLIFNKKIKFEINTTKTKRWIIISALTVFLVFYMTTKNIKFVTVDKFYFLLIECFSVGFLEEILFRYLFFKYTYNRTNKLTYSIVLTSSIFALFHISNLFFGYSLYSVINQIEIAFILALLLQFIFLKTNSLVLVITLHALINFVGSQKSLNKSDISEIFTFNDFIFNQIFILLIYVIFIPIYYWALKINFEHKHQN